VQAGLRRVLRRHFYFVAHPRHAARQAGGRGLRAARRERAVPPLWPSGAAGRVRPVSASPETCGSSTEEAYALLAELERLTAPDSVA